MHKDSAYLKQIQRDEDNHHLMMKRMQEWEEDSVYEKEADHVAEKVSNHHPVNVSHLTTIAGQPPMTKKSEDQQTAEKNIHPQIESSKHSGESISSPLRFELESKMNADFSNVKIHNDPAAHDMNKNINAKAFTSGNHIYFGNNNYKPNENEGTKLLAHELTHTLQQQTGTVNQVQRKNGDDLLTGLKKNSSFNVKDGEFDKIAQDFSAKPGADVKPKDKSSFEKKYRDNRIFNLQEKNYKKALREELKNTIDFTLKKIKQRTGTPLPKPALESIANLAKDTDLKWIGSFIGVTNKDTDFRTGGAKPNLFPMEDNVQAITGKLSPGEQKTEWERKGKDVIRAYAIIKLAWLHRKFEVTEPKVENAVKFVAGKLQQEDFYLLQRTFRGETVNIGQENVDDIILLDTLPYSDLKVFETMIDQAELPAEKLQELRSIAADMMIKKTSNAFFYEGVVRHIDARIASKELANRTYGTSKTQLDTETFNAAGTDTQKFDNLKRLLLDDKPKDATQSPLEAEFDKWEGNAFENDTSVGTPVIARKEITLRYQVFQTMLHEFLHYVTDINYQNEIEKMGTTDPAKRNILLEGVIDLFAFKIWEQFRSTLSADNAARGVIEGWWNDPSKPPPLQNVPAFHPELIPPFPVYDEIYAAHAIESKVGLDNMKAAFFLGHTELLGFGAAHSSLNSTVKNTQVVIPGYDKDEFTKTMYEVAFQRGLYQVVEGEEKIFAMNLIYQQKQKLVEQIENKIKELEKQLLEAEKANKKREIVRLKNEIAVTKAQAQKAQLQRDIVQRRAGDHLNMVLLEKENNVAKAQSDLESARKSVKMDELEKDLEEARKMLEQEAEGGYAWFTEAEKKVNSAKTVIMPQQDAYDHAVKAKTEITDRINALNPPVSTVDELREKARQDLKNAEEDVVKKNSSLQQDITNAKNKKEKNNIYDALMQAERKVQVLKEIDPAAQISEFSGKSADDSYNTTLEYKFPYEGTADQNWKNYSHYSKTGMEMDISNGKTYILRNDNAVISLNDATLDELYKDNTATLTKPPVFTYKNWFNKLTRGSKENPDVFITLNVDSDAGSKVRKAADKKISI